MKLYILENKQTKLEPDYDNWNAWKQSHLRDCVVANTPTCEMWITTTFRGYDPNEKGYLFCIKVTGKGKWDGQIYEAKTWEQAEQFHQWTCEKIVREYEKDLMQNAHRV